MDYNDGLTNSNASHPENSSGAKRRKRLDGRSADRRARHLRKALIAYHGGSAALSPADLMLIDAASRTAVILAELDARLLDNPDLMVDDDGRASELLRHRVTVSNSLVSYLCRLPAKGSTTAGDGKTRFWTRIFKRTKPAAKPDKFFGPSTGFSKRAFPEPPDFGKGRAYREKSKQLMTISREMAVNR
jgi:hypothetical protein